MFSVMSEAEASCAEYVDVRVDEHRSLAASLDVFVVALPGHRARLRFEVGALAEHIEREEDGLFRASLIALSGASGIAPLTPGRALTPAGT